MPSASAPTGPSSSSVEPSAASEKVRDFRARARWAVRAAGATGLVLGALHLMPSLVLASACLPLLGWRETLTPLQRAVAVGLGWLVLLLGAASLHRMGIPGALSLVLIGAGLLALVWKRSVSTWLGLAACGVALVPAVGRLYGVDAPALTTTWPTIIALVVVGAGISLAASGTGPVPLFWREDAGGVLLRRSLGPALLLPIGLGLLRLIGERRGLYELPVGTALFAVALSLLSCLLLWQSARRLSSLALRSEVSQRSSEERFRALITASSEALYRMSPDWRQMHEIHSRGFLADTDSPSREWLEKYIHPDDQPQVTAAIEEAIAQRSIFQMEHRVRRADGSLGWTSSRAVPLMDEHGEVLEWFGAADDITERKRSEEALRQANQQLQELDRRKDDFLAVLSHELRNPLAPIRTSASLLERAPPGSEQARRASQVISRQAQQMTRLIDDLLDVSRISRGKITLKRERLDLAALARGTAEDFREVFEASEVGLSVEESGQALWVEGDRTRLAQVIGNLLSNAVKFTAAGGKTQLTLGTNAAGEVTVQVRDDGSGLSPATREHLFEPFMQAAQTIERSRGGLGLGLALTRGLVELHGGRITVFSEGEGKGATFTVTLPELQVDAWPTKAVPARARVPSQRVLVVEDNQDAAESLREVLELGDHRVEIAHSGPAGVDAARKVVPDIVLCDLGLPELDGYGVARAIRSDADPRLRATFLVALSGYALPEDVSRARQAGFDRHLSKPTSIEALEQVLEEALAQAGR